MTYTTRQYQAVLRCLEQRPEEALTRQQMWTMMARMNGIEPANMAEAQAWAMANGLSDGTNPAVRITRQQFVTMLWRMLQWKGQLSGEAGADLSVHADSHTVSEYAVDALEWASGLEIVQGYQDNTLRPHISVSRAHAAAILMRMYANLA